MEPGNLERHIIQNFKINIENQERMENPLIKGVLLGTTLSMNPSLTKAHPKTHYTQIHPRPEDQETSRFLFIYSKLIIPFNSSFKKFRDIIVEFTLAYNVITTLFFLAYSKPGENLSIIDLFCWVILFFDIPITFITEIKTRKGALSKSFSKISKYYIKSWLLIDILSILPLSLFKYDNAEYYLRMLRLLKLPRVLNITDGNGISFLLTFVNLGQKEKNGKVFYSLKVRVLASIIQIFVTIIFLVYFLGCFWFWFQRTVANYRYSQGSQDEEEFAEAFNLNTFDIEDIALRNAYYMLTTISTIGYGDFLPKNTYEMAFVAIVMLFGVTLFGFVLASFNSAMRFFNEIGKNYEIGKLNIWLESIENIKGKMKKSLRKRIIRHFCYYLLFDRLKSLAKNSWEFDEHDDLSKITQKYVKDMPEEVYYNILKTLFNDFLLKFRVFFTESRFKFDIIPFLQPRKFEKDTYVTRKSEKIDEVIFVLSGIVSVGVSIHFRYIPLVKFEGGRTLIGDYAALTGQNNRFNFYAETFLQAYSLQTDVFITILSQKYKADRMNILKIATEKEFTLRKLVRSYDLSSDASLQDVLLENPTRRRAKKTFIDRKKPIYSDENFHQNVESFGFSLRDLGKKSTKLITLLEYLESGLNNTVNEIK